MTDLEGAVGQACQAHDNDKHRLVDIAHRLQRELGCVSPMAIDALATRLQMPRVDVESTVSFYSFFNTQPTGRVVIRLCNDIVDQMFGAQRVAAALREELGIDFGETTGDGQFTLKWTSCIGMSDQAPAALVNDRVFTRLSSDSARELVRQLRGNGSPEAVKAHLGDGNNGHNLVRAMVNNNIRERGPVLLQPFTPANSLRAALAMSPVEVIKSVKASRLRGRGGAGFPTGMKWELTRGADGTSKVVICNADEGEPGTFKDRVLLTEMPDLVFEGMTIAGYATGAATGILYLRAEYTYLRSFLESILARRRREQLLGRRILGKRGFHFDIRIQLGAGAYICGEETALINSCEGLRGDPRNRPPFPAQRGYLGQPTSVNNVETLCCVARILERGAGWFSAQGTPESTGTKLLSVSGDCHRAGIYEIPLGTPLREVLRRAGGEDAAFVQVGGPSGSMVAPDGFDRPICFGDLATGGSLMVFGAERDLLAVVRNFMDFFVEESCGYCTPCRVGNQLLSRRIGDIMAGNGQPEDIEYLRNLSETVKATSRCGLGQSSPNPVQSSLLSFPDEYARRLREPHAGHRATFNGAEALRPAEVIAGRRSRFLASD